MKNNILIIDSDDNTYSYLNNNLKHSTLRAEDSNEAIAHYSRTDSYIGLSFINISSTASLAYSDSQAMYEMLKIKNHILPSIAYYEADKVDVTQLKMFETFKENNIFLIILEFQQLKTSLHKLENLYREKKTLIKLQTGGVWAIKKPQIIVPVIEADHHAVEILSLYGGLLIASLREQKQEERLKRYFSIMGLELKSIMGWLIVVSYYREFRKKAS